MPSSRLRLALEIGTLVAALWGSIAGTLALLQTHANKEEVDRLEAKRLLDKAWDALGGRDGEATRLVYDRQLTDADIAKLEAAKRDIEDAISLCPSLENLAVVRGTYLARAGNLDEAARHFGQAIKASNENRERARLHSNISVVLMRQGKTDEALQEVEKAIKAAPQESHAYYNKAVILMAMDDVDRAMEAIKVAIKKDDKSPELYLTEGNVFRCKGDQDSAISSYRKALSKKPQYSEARVNLALCLREKNRWAEAKNELRKAIRFDQNCKLCYFGLGVIEAHGGNLVQAVEHFEQALELDPAIMEAYRNLGVIYLSQRQLDRAEAYMRDALALDEDDPITLYYLSRIRAAQGDVKEAKELKEKSDSLKETGKKQGTSCLDKMQRGRFPIGGQAARSTPGEVNTPPNSIGASG